LALVVSREPWAMSFEQEQVLLKAQSPKPKASPIR